MRLLRIFLPIVVAVGFISTSAFGLDLEDFSRFDKELNERDFEALKDYINTKRTINVQEKACNLTIAGDVRTEWRHMNEKQCGKSLRGHDACHPYQNINQICIDADGNQVEKEILPTSHNDFDIEFNLYFDYVCDRAWAVAQLEFDNTAGVWGNLKCCKTDPQGWHGSGWACDLNLKKAYMGYNICCLCDTRFDVEIGRRHLYHVFDSQVQFLSQFDGITFKYSSSLECIADWYIYLAGFVVDERVNQFAWITEGGVCNLFDCGIDLKYSFIDWRKNGKNRCKVHNPKAFKFMISQWTMYYRFNPEFVCMPAYLFGAYIWNHDAPKWKRSNYKKEDKAWYAGFHVGEVIQEGDWAFEIQYQYVEAQAVPDRDVSGIGRGNVLDESFTVNSRGNTNYKGWRVEFLYALTDNLTFDAILEASRDICSNLGGSHSYSKFELEAIYAF